jgi:hypothetical protein
MQVSFLSTKMWFYNYDDVDCDDHDNDDGDENDVYPLISVDELPLIYNFHVIVGVQVILDNSVNIEVMLKWW